MINICVPVIKRYDLLAQLILSLRESLVQPDKIFVIDNGRRLDSEGALRRELGGAVDYFSHVPLALHRPDQPMGVAEAWNWFIAHAPEERVIVNDDCTFAPESLTCLLRPTADLVWAAGVGFSCFVLRDSCVQKIGLFDETISPGYGYYEDEDYLQRLDGRGTRERSAIADEVVCGVKHLHSGTLKAKSHEEVLEHHRKFKIAQANYAKKWHLEEAFR